MYYFHLILFYILHGFIQDIDRIMLLHGARVMESVKPILDSETRTEEVKEQVKHVSLLYKEMVAQVVRVRYTLDHPITPYPTLFSQVQAPLEISGLQKTRNPAAEK